MDNTEDVIRGVSAEDYCRQEDGMECARCIVERQGLTPAALDGMSVRLAYDAESNCLCLNDATVKWLIGKLFGFHCAAIDLIDAAETIVSGPWADVSLPAKASFQVNGAGYETDFQTLWRVAELDE